MIWVTIGSGNGFLSDGRVNVLVTMLYYEFENYIFRIIVKSLMGQCINIKSISGEKY